MRFRAQVTACYAGVFLLVLAGAVAGGTASAQDKGAPPWGEFLRRFNRDRLLREPFHMDEAANVKGLASKIRARELDVPNRIRAIRYLGELDCRVFPEAKEMLLKQLNPEEEKWEEVRFEAAKALRDMFERNSCCTGAADGSGNPCEQCQQSQNCQQCQDCYQGGAACDCQQSCTDSCTTCDSQMSFWDKCRDAAGKARKSVSRNDKKNGRGGRRRGEEDTRPCHCKTCCDADTLNTLARTAYELTPDGCCYEPSLRVREMAVEAISVCGIPCNYAPYYATGAEQGPGPVEDGVQQNNNNNIEVIPPVRGEEGATGGADSTQILPPTIPGVTVVTPISRLKEMCIVSLKSGKQVAARKEFSSAYRGRLYYFSSDSARRQFDAHPEQYAVAFGGCDPVHFVQTREAVEGRFLSLHEDRFYMFSTRENAATFKADPERYSGRPAEKANLTAAR
jgi:YHS domain-containing protein